MPNAIVANTPLWHESGVTGAGPALWYGNSAPNGDTAPWLLAPIGSLYCYKTSTTAATWYIKIAAGSADTDWISFAGVGQDSARLWALVPQPHQSPRNDKHAGFNSPSGPLPVTDWFDSHQVAIPSGWWLTRQELDAVAEAVIGWSSAMEEFMGMFS